MNAALNANATSDATKSMRTGEDTLIARKLLDFDILTSQIAKNVNVDNISEDKKKPSNSGLVSRTRANTAR